MNERVQWRHRRVIVASIAALAILSGGWWSYCKFVQWATKKYGITQVHLSYHDVGDEKLTARIAQWFEQRKNDGILLSQSRTDLIQRLVESFPLIRKVSWGTYLPGHLHCAITGVLPTFLINDQYIAGNNGKLYTSRDFAEYPATIPQIHISKNWLSSNVFGRVHTFFSALPIALIKTYNLYYHDPYTVALVPVAFNEVAHRCVCLVDEKSASQVRSLDELMELCTDLKNRVKPKEKDPICFFDFRFNDRIISRTISRSELIQLQRVRQ